MQSLPSLPQDENIDISADGLNYILKNYDPSCP